MAGQARRSIRRHGRSPRGASLPVLAAAAATASGRTPTSRSVIASIRPPATRATYRSLLQKGLKPEEAANLTAFLCGIHVGSQRWKLNEVNRLLFLRELQLAGRFGLEDGAESLA